MFDVARGCGRECVRGERRQRVERVELCVEVAEDIIGHKPTHHFAKTDLPASVFLCVLVVVIRVLQDVTHARRADLLVHRRAAESLCTAQHSTAQHSTQQHSTAHNSTAQHTTAQQSTQQHNTAHNSTAQHKSIVQHNSTALHKITAQHSTQQHSTQQHSTRS